MYKYIGFFKVWDFVFFFVFLLFLLIELLIEINICDGNFLLMLFDWWWWNKIVRLIKRDRRINKFEIERLFINIYKEYIENIL